jgi:hypothetical protein
MLEQVPNPDSARTLAVIEGLLRAADDFDLELMQTAVQLVPERAPRILEAAVRTGTPVRLALQAVAGALLPVWTKPVQPTLEAATRLGLDPGEANTVLEEVRQSTPCRIEGAGAKEQAAADQQGARGCHPSEEMRHASRTAAPLLAFGTGTRPDA